MTSTRIKDRLSVLVPGQLPDFVQAEYPLFVEFMTAYQQFLEQDQAPYEVLQNMRAYADVDQTITSLIRKFFSNYGEDSPIETAADIRLFLKRISDLYGAKGSEKAFDLLFNIMYGEAIEFFYPSSVILRPSDGKWERDISLKCFPTTEDDDPYLLQDTRIQGMVSGATAIVGSVFKRVIGQVPIFELFLDEESIEGTFRPAEPVTGSKLLRIVDGVPVYANSNVALYSVLGDIDVAVPGMGYEVNQLVTIDESGTVQANGKVLGVNRFGGITNIRMLDTGARYTRRANVTIGRPTGYRSDVTHSISNNLVTVTFASQHGLQTNSNVIVSYFEDLPGANLANGVIEDYIVRSAGQFTLGFNGVDTEYIGLFASGNSTPIFRANLGSYGVSVYDTSNAAFREHQDFDIVSNAAAATAMVDYLDSLASNTIVFVHTNGSANTAYVANIETSIWRIGASSNVYSNTRMYNNDAYILVGIPGVGDSKGMELHLGDRDDDVFASGELQVRIADGLLLGQRVQTKSIPTRSTIRYKKSSSDRSGNVRVFFDDRANLSPNISAITVTESTWINNDGMLSESMRIQGRALGASETDPIYYQPFSYVIRSEHPLNEWRDYALDLVHPAGRALFNELKIQTDFADLKSLKLVSAGDAEIQDFFAITADKAQRSGPGSPEFRVGMTVFPPPSQNNARIIDLSDSAFVYSQNKFPTDYITVECLFVKEKYDPAVYITDVSLFSKEGSWWMRTDSDRLQYAVHLQGRGWGWIDSGYRIRTNTPYVVALSYNGSQANLYVNGSMVHNAINDYLALQPNLGPHVIADQNSAWVKLNSRGLVQNIQQGPGPHRIGVFRLYDRALTDAEIVQNYQDIKARI